MNSSTTIPWFSNLGERSSIARLSSVIPLNRHFRKKHASSLTVEAKLSPDLKYSVSILFFLDLSIISRMPLSY